MRETIVIKVGGGAGIDPTTLAPQIAELVAQGLRPVLVHGGSNETDTLAERGPSAKAPGQPIRTREPPHRPSHA